MRVYEVAKELGLDNKVVVGLFQSVGTPDVRNHMSAVSAADIERVKKLLDKQQQGPAAAGPAPGDKVVEQRVTATVVKRIRNKPADEPRVEVREPAPPTREAPRREVGREQPAARAPQPAPRESAPREHAPRESAQSEAAAREPAPRESAARDSAGRDSAATEAAARESGSAGRESAVGDAATQPSDAQSREPQAAAAEPSAATNDGGNRESKQASDSTRPAGEATVAQAPRERTDSAEAGAAERSSEQPREVATSDAGDAKAEPTMAELVGSDAPAGADGPRVVAAGNKPGPKPAANSKFIAAGQKPGPRPATVRPPEGAAAPSIPPPPGVPGAAAAGTQSVPPPRKTGIDVWEGRPGVPMPTPAQRGPMPRRTTYDAKAPGGFGPQRRPGAPMPGGPMMGRPGMGGRPGMMGRPGMGRPGFGGPVQRGRGAVPMNNTQERSAHKKVVKIETTIGLQALGIKMGVKAHELLRKLMMLGMTGVNINTTLDADTAKIVASEFGWEVEDVAISEEDQIQAAQGNAEEEIDEALEPRPPVVTVMGHVDHGKTSLLDAIRKATVAKGEAGGITQHIGAYSVETPRGRITFLDTPGHEAFSAMRARGAQVTDVIILVVAADDGVMPQTLEAIAHAKSAKVPVVVAVNKCDKPDAHPDRVRRELSEHGLQPEEWGGTTLFAEVSAMTGKGIEDLLDRVLLQSEMLELRANPDKPGVAVVIEAELDRGKGPVATVLVTEGTMRRGDILLAGAGWGKVRVMLDEHGRSVKEAGPSTPVAIVGLSDVPSAGDPVHVVQDTKKAQEIAESRKTKVQRSVMPSKGGPTNFQELIEMLNKTEQLEFKLIVKADVQGSVEAVKDALLKLSTEKVKVVVVHAGAGAITEGDVNLAVAAGATIIGFNVKPAGKAGPLAQRENVEIRQYSIIYNVLDDVKSAMEGLLAPKMVERAIGKAEVRAVFKLSKAGTIAGCFVTEGVIKRNAGVRVFRGSDQVFEGKVASLKRFKDDAREVKEGFECGIAVENFQALAEGDIIAAFELEAVKQTL